MFDSKTLQLYLYFLVLVSVPVATFSALIFLISKIFNRKTNFLLTILFSIMIYFLVGLTLVMYTTVRSPYRELLEVDSLRLIIAWPFWLAFAYIAD